jgi:RNA polymerase sigma-70 factor (ECF subfamily)
VTAETPARPRETALLAAAAGGDEEAFRLLTEPHRRALHLHCYRMLASIHDADDALQETLLRAWQGLGRFQPRTALAAWLHTIATNVCLTAIGRRRRRHEIPAAEVGEAAWNERLLRLEPYPDRLLAELEAASPDPETRYVQRETVELAFVTTVQLLPPKQRAVLILRDVLGWSANETAEALEDTVAAVNSALQRARANLERVRPLGAPSHASDDDAEDRALLARFMQAWDAVDIDGIVRLLTRDALMTMPPTPTYVLGAERIGEFFATVPAEGFLDRIRLVPTRANHQPALAAYMQDEDGAHRAYGIMVFAFDRGRISGIVGFADASLFDRFGMPIELASQTLRTKMTPDP